MASEQGKCQIWGTCRNEFDVRNACSSDLKTVFSMIIELAADLKADVIEDVSLSEDQFVSDYQNGYFRLIVIEKKKIIYERNDNNQKDITQKTSNATQQTTECFMAGYALYNFAYETWSGRVARLDDIYIRKPYRNLGLGTYLMAALAKITIDNNCKSLKWQCLDWNKNGLEFYFNKLNAIEEVQEKEGKKFKLVNIEISDDQLKNLSLQLK